MSRQLLTSSAILAQVQEDDEENNSELTRKIRSFQCEH